VPRIVIPSLSYSSGAEVSVTWQPHSKLAVQFPVGFAKLVGRPMWTRRMPMGHFVAAPWEFQNPRKIYGFSPTRSTTAGLIAVPSDPHHTSPCQDVLPFRLHSRRLDPTRADEVIE
jgi:hypothetical protein